MLQILGEYDCKIDAKGRMRLPVQLLKQLRQDASHIFVINRGVERCLKLYPKKVWDEFSLKVTKLNPYKKKNRDFIRYFYRGASELTLDSADRILLSKRLLEYAGIDKEVIIMGMQDHVEIWSKPDYDELIENEPDNFSDLAEDVWGDKEYNGSADSDDGKTPFE